MNVAMQVAQTERIFNAFLRKLLWDRSFAERARNGCRTTGAFSHYRAPHWSLVA